MKHFRSWGGAYFLGSLTVLTLSWAPASAQTLTALSNFERSVNPNSTHTSLTLSLPANVLAAIAGGALELREQTNYNAQQNTLTSTFFAAQPSSTTPTNLAQTNASSVFGSLTMTVDKIYIGSKPVPSVMFVGTISQASMPFGNNFQGAPASYSFAYSSDTPPKVTNIVEVIAGTVVSYSATSAGTFTITQPPGTGGGTGTGITIVVTSSAVPAGTNTFETTSNQVALNASGSTSTNTGALTYSWVSSPGFPAGGIIGANTATPLLQLNTKGVYQFTVTVTDAKGVTATQNITVRYI